MIKRIIIWALIISFFLVVAAYLVINLFIPEKDYRVPGRFGSYPSSGMYIFNPEMIFESLAQEKTDVFTPYVGNPDEIKLYYDPITWSQSDYLKFASATSQKVWGESLSSKNWSLASVYFAQDCKDNPQGFNRFHIVYYKDLGVTGWKRNYTTRLIDVEPWRGLAYWGGDATFSSTLIARWRDIGVEDFAISADDALQIAEKHGGNQTDKSDCSTISVSMYQRDNEKWDVKYFAADFGMYIDPNSEKYEIHK
jgi:hypothetical protein